jgi:hypothetical protein
LDDPGIFLNNKLFSSQHLEAGTSVPELESQQAASFSLLEPELYQNVKP